MKKLFVLLVAVSLSTAVFAKSTSTTAKSTTTHHAHKAAVKK